MALAIVFASVVADGLSPVTGAASFEVLARQVPRLLVARLNGGGDRGLRFFPFLGPVDGQRCFLRPNELFDPSALAALHRQGDVELLVDGKLRQGSWLWRFARGDNPERQTVLELPFDPRRPLDALPRLEFELASALGLPGRPLPLPRLTGEALGWFLVLKDELLRREASLPPSGPDLLRAARRCVALQPEDRDVQDLVCDFAANLLRHGQHRAELAVLLASLAAAVGDDVPLLERLDALLLAAGDPVLATTLACRAATLQPERAELVERAAAQAYGLDRFGEVHTVVQRARQCGVASPAAVAQLAAVCDRLGDRALRRELVEDLLARPKLSVPVARLLVSFLLEEERAEAALAVVDRTIEEAPDHAMLHFERGRAGLLLGDEAVAVSALRRAVDLGLQPAVYGLAQRFLRLLSVPGLWSGSHQVERLLAVPDLAAAEIAARALLHRVGPVAEAWFLLGLVRHRLGRVRSAERLLRRALRCDVRLPDAHNRLGILLVDSGRLEEGQRHLEMAHQLAPADPSPLLHLAQACALLGQQADAEAHLAAAERCGADPELASAVRREIVRRPA